MFRLERNSQSAKLDVLNAAGVNLFRLERNSQSAKLAVSETPEKSGDFRFL